MVAELVGPADGELRKPPRTPASDQGSARVRLPVLDGVRGFAAVGVLLVHTSFYAGVMEVGGAPGVPVISWLAVGLTVALAPFFLLSGLFLYRPFAKATFTGTKRPPLKQFFVRRMLRILPTYWVVVAVSLLLIGLATINGAWDVIRPVLLLQFFVDTDAPRPGMEITWSVVTEFIYYLLLPVAAALFNKFRVSDPDRQLRRIIWSLVPVVLVGPAWVVYTHLPFMGPYPVEIFWPPGFIGLIAIGMMFGALSAHQEVTGREPAIYRLARSSPLSWWTAAFAVFLLNCVKPFDKAGSGAYPSISQAVMDHALFLLFAVLVMVPLIAPGVRSRLMDGMLGNRVTTFLGRISFGIYLWHFPMIYFALGAGSMFGTDPMPMISTEFDGLLIAQVLLGSIVLSTLSYYLVERPAGRFGGRLLKTGAPTAAL